MSIHESWKAARLLEIFGMKPMDISLPSWHPTAYSTYMQSFNFRYIVLRTS